MAKASVSRAEANAYRLRGNPEEGSFRHIVTGVLPTDRLLEKAHEQGLIVSLWPGQSVADAMLGVYLGADFLCTDIPVEVMNYMKANAPWVKASY